MLNFFPFIKNFEVTWIGHSNNSPKVPIHVWNNCYRVLDRLNRTNNHVEGWHNSLRHKSEKSGIFP